jgi:hypothetical protein
VNAHMYTTHTHTGLQVENEQAEHEDQNTSLCTFAHIHLTNTNLVPCARNCCESSTINQSTYFYL